MTEMEKGEEEELLKKYPHLKKYVEEVTKNISKPVFYTMLSFEIRNEPYPNLIYPTRGSIFIHILKTKNMEETEYFAIEPDLSDAEKEKYEGLLKIVVKRAPEKKSVISDDELREIFRELFDEIIVIDEKAEAVEKEKKGLLNNNKKYIVKATSVQRDNIEYLMIKNLIGGGPIECFMRDPYLEDIHIISGQKVFLTHKIFGMIKTNIEINAEKASLFSKKLSEKMGNPASEGQPIVDGVLPDGSRGNIIYSDSISLKGPSITIRKFSENPISITQLIKWGTMSSGIAAYLWLSCQYGRSFFMCGETASGKTTTMNAVLPFIPPNKKIYTAESTPEMKAPHTVWQQLLTKSTGPEEGRVDLFQLLKAALRSRPDYIIPGEVRGIEGNIVFQAMQTGHPCMTTFHADSLTRVIQRFTGHPINVPKTFMDNLDFVLIQQAVEREGHFVRRVITLDEIEGYNRAIDGVMARTAFEWDPVEDIHRFKASRNSYILEQKIGKFIGYSDPAEIYDEYDRRKHILDRMVEEDIMDYYEFVQCIWSFYREGEKGIPITL